jgi:hypothetical protein
MELLCRDAFGCFSFLTGTGKLALSVPKFRPRSTNLSSKQRTGLHIAPRSMEDQSMARNPYQIWNDASDAQRMGMFFALRTALSECIEHMEWSTPQGKAAWEAAQLALSPPNSGGEKHG